MTNLGVTDSPLLLFFKNKRREKTSFPVSFTLDFTIYRGRMGTLRGGGGGCEESKRVGTATSVMMTHLAPSETEACEAFNWHCSHEE